MTIKLGLVSPEYFSYKKIKGKLVPTSSHGGLGFLTKIKAQYLAQAGYEVHVFTFLDSFDYSHNSPTEITEDGVKLHLITESNRIGRNIVSTGIKSIIHPIRENKQFDEIINKEDLDIIQFEDTPTTLLMSVHKDIPKILIFQDPFDYYDANLLADSDQNYLNLLSGHLEPYIIKSHPNNFLKESMINFMHKKNFVKPVKKIILKSQHLNIYTEADFIGKKVKNLFKLNYTPKTIRNPIPIYNKKYQKTEKPSFVWIARWDPQKRPDMMLHIASKLPKYEFYMIGSATNNAKNYISIEKRLTSEFSAYPNIHILGFIDEEMKKKYIGEAWGLINTSIREGLPITFLEALAEGTPIVSYVDPDNYTSKFGVKVDYTIESFKQGIEKTVSERLYEKIGNIEREYAIKEHGLTVIMNKQINLYEEMLEHRK
ncbi:MAG: glycosyltransferase family 4 protein [Caldisphaera sp.]